MEKTSTDERGLVRGALNKSMIASISFLFKLFSISSTIMMPPLVKASKAVRTIRVPLVVPTDNMSVACT